MASSDSKVAAFHWLFSADASQVPAELQGLASALRENEAAFEEWASKAAGAGKKLENAQRSVDEAVIRLTGSTTERQLLEVDKRYSGLLARARKHGADTAKLEAAIEAQKKAIRDGAVSAEIASWSKVRQSDAALVESKGKVINKMGLLKASTDTLKGSMGLLGQSAGKVEAAMALVRAAGVTPLTAGLGAAAAAFLLVANRATEADRKLREFNDSSAASAARIRQMRDELELLRRGFDPIFAVIRAKELEVAGLAEKQVAAQRERAELDAKGLKGLGETLTLQKILMEKAEERVRLAQEAWHVAQRQLDILYGQVELEDKSLSTEKARGDEQKKIVDGLVAEERQRRANLTAAEAQLALAEKAYAAEMKRLNEKWAAEERSSAAAERALKELSKFTLPPGMREYVELTERNAKIMESVAGAPTKFVEELNLLFAAQEEQAKSLAQASAAAEVYADAMDAASESTAGLEAEVERVFYGVHDVTAAIKAGTSEIAGMSAGWQRAAKESMGLVSGVYQVSEAFLHMAQAADRARLDIIGAHAALRSFADPHVLLRAGLTLGASGNIGNLPRFATGADFIVPGAGPVDSVPFAGMVSPGERIRITPKGESGREKGAVQVGVSVTIHNSAADVARVDVTQVEGGILVAIAKDIRAGGIVSKAIEGTYGSHRQSIRLGG